MNIPEKVSEAVRALNPHLYATLQPQAIQLPHDLKATKADVKAEKELQRLCENGLNQRGYVNLTNTNAAQFAATNAVGWYGHLPKPQGNAFMPDLFIFDAKMARCLMVELKTHNVFQVGQKEMVQVRAWWLATTYDEFISQLEAWEEHNKGE